MEQLNEKQKKLIKHDEYDLSYISRVLSEFNEKLWKKSRNAYQSYNITMEELNIIRYLSRVLNKYNTFKSYVKKIRSEKEDNLKKEKAYKNQSAFIALSYDGLRENFKEVKKASHIIKTSLQELKDIDYQISDL